MKTSLKKLVKEELKAMITEKAKMSSKFRKAMEALYDVEYEQQELRKKFVAEKSPAKRESIKKQLITLHKKVKDTQLDFNRALANEPIDDSIEEAAPKMTVHPDAQFVSDIISRLVAMGRRHTGPNIKKDLVKTLKVLQNLRSSIQVGR